MPESSEDELVLLLVPGAVQEHGVEPSRAGAGGRVRTYMPRRAQAFKLRPTRVLARFSLNASERARARRFRMPEMGLNVRGVQGCSRGGVDGRAARGVSSRLRARGG
jgi:hypothetical protein